MDRGTPFSCQCFELDVLIYDFRHTCECVCVCVCVHISKLLELFVEELGKVCDQSNSFSCCASDVCLLSVSLCDTNTSTFLQTYLFFLLVKYYLVEPLSSCLISGSPLSMINYRKDTVA